jgi:hypothetical protein
VTTKCYTHEKKSLEDERVGPTSLHVEDLITCNIGDSRSFSKPYRAFGDKCWYRQSHIDPEKFFVATEIKSWACRRGSLIIEAFGVEIYNSGRFVERIRGTGSWAVWQPKFEILSVENVYIILMNFVQEGTLICKRLKLLLRLPGEPDDTGSYLRDVI